MKEKTIDKKEYISKLQNMDNGIISFARMIPKDANLKIIKHENSYSVHASYPTFDVNFKRWGMELYNNKNEWGIKVISATHAVSISDILIREICRANHLIEIKDFANLQAIAAKWSTKKINDLPDAAFALVKPGGKKEDGGNTGPRSLRILPHHTMSVKKSTDNNTIDKVHLRNALSRVNQGGTELTPEQRKIAKLHLEAHARALKIGKYRNPKEARAAKMAARTLEMWRKGD